MNNKLQGRITLAIAAVIALSYFLPWMSIMTPFGTVEFKGQFLDYSWLVLVFSLSFLIAEFASQNVEALGVPTTAVPRLALVEQVSPFLILGFVVWAGANFEVHRHFGTISALFGGDPDSAVRASFDYGYWLAAVSVLCLITIHGLRTTRIRQFAGASIVVVTVAVAIAFAINWRAHALEKSASVTLPQTTEDSPTSAPSPPQSTFDASPYVIVVSASGRANSKNVEAERFSDSVDVNLKFQNLTNKTIVGLRGRVAVLDGFGKAVYFFGFRDDDKILPKSSEGRGSYNFEHNQFEDDDPYSKMDPLIEAGTAKYQVTITDIAFSDGSVLPAK